MMFSKSLVSLPIPEAGKVIKNLGFEGVDLTVRPGGHVQPEEVMRALPEAVRILKDLGLAVPLLTTSITRASDPAAKDILESAGKLGTREIKLGYWPYKGFGHYSEGLDAMARDLDGIENLARNTGVRANLHTHSGNYMTAVPFAIWQLIKDRDPKAIGAYLDPGHMTLEWSQSGWKMGLDLLSSRLSVLAIKDIALSPSEPGGTRSGASRVRSRPILVPLGEGLVPWEEVMVCLRQIGFKGWASVHSEYQEGYSWKSLTVPEIIEQTRADMAYLQRVGKDVLS